MRKFRPRGCYRCFKEFLPSVGTQKYCGSKTAKTGCSWLMVAKRDKLRANFPHRKAQRSKLIKEWKKKQRRQNTDYAKRQREVKKAYARTERGKALSRLSRKRNILTILQCNRRRMLVKKGVIGFHNSDQWENLKSLNDYRCVSCKIDEIALQAKWGKSWLSKLTKDHIIPLSKGGTDYIENIQPLCVSCNSMKKDLS
jgi:5-methylcytosine-specific restriction endonuclease McrA